MLCSSGEPYSELKQLLWNFACIIASVDILRALSEGKEQMLGRFRVLLAEDIDLIREIVVASLEEAGFEVVEASTGLQALGVIQARSDIDALVTDIRLGAGPDGWDVAEAFRKAHPRKPVIYTSAYRPGEDRSVDLSLFFAKPYKVAKMEAALWALLKPPVSDEMDDKPPMRDQRMTRLTYMSRPTPLALRPNPAEATLLLREQAQRLNRENGLTGALLVGSEYFIQVLEGERAPLTATLARITRDPRHDEVRVFELTATKQRMFADWAMHLGALDRVDPELVWRCVESFKKPSPARASFLIDALTQSVRAAA